MAAFDFFITLDGNCLNGFEGLCGVARLRCDPDADRWEKDVHFFEGLAGGHATQVNPTGTLGFLGNLSQTLLFYDPRTLREVRRLSTLRFCAPDVLYSSQTHVVWLSDKTFITVLGDSFWRFDMDGLEHPEHLLADRAGRPDHGQADAGAHAGPSDGARRQVPLLPPVFSNCASCLATATGKKSSCGITRV